MKRIGILSDTHGTFDAPLRDFFADVDELWHAGDFGGVETADVIAAFKPLRGVYGNIDGGAVRLAYPRWQLFDCEEGRGAVTHIGGYPGRYGGDRLLPGGVGCAWRRGGGWISVVGG